MPPQFPSEDGYMPMNATAVAVDKDKNSPFAVRWAMDHLAISSQLLILIHVKPKNNQAHHGSLEYGYFATGALAEAEIDQLFHPFRGYCARRGVELREVILEEGDICKALLEYIGNNFICNFVVGASTRNAFTRKFKSYDVSATLLKSAPDFCTVYVISKGKVSSVRQAQRSIAHPPRVLSPTSQTPPRLLSPPSRTPSRLPSPTFCTPLQLPSPTSCTPPGFPSPTSCTPPKLPSPTSCTPPGFPSPTSCTPPGLPSPTSCTPPGLPSPDTNRHGHKEMDEGPREQEAKKNAGPRRAECGRVPDRRSSTNGGQLMENIDISNHSPRSSTSKTSSINDGDFLRPQFFRSADVNDQTVDHPVTSGFPNVKLSSPSGKNLEAEMRRLKLEIKRTRDLYSTARKEVHSAKQKAKELSQWKLEEAQKLEEARKAEEAAHAIAEIEKARRKAIMDQAGVAQRLAEKEAQRRRKAELKAKQEEEEKYRAASSPQHDVRYRKYTIDEIEIGTENFSDSNRIGEGGYGPVFKGSIDHTPVAIKLLRPDAVQGRKQFQREVEVLSCIRHPNMVLLLGACPEYGCLVYEYMRNGSLEDRLLQKGNTPPISWRQRFCIAAEIATALLFLHQAKPEPLVHRDLKPANILLDSNYVSKISDVGLARLVPPEIADTVTRYHMTAAAGTFYYIDPEYQQTGKLTTKSDIYSFGVMLLQIITAKPPMGLSHHVSRAIDKGKLAEILDPAVTDWPIEEALSFAKVALKCTELRKKDRPDLRQVILPELNRLRDLGMNSEPESTGGYMYSFCNSSSSSHSPRNAPHSPCHEYIFEDVMCKDSRSTSTDEGSDHQQNEKDDNGE